MKLSATLFAAALTLVIGSAGYVSSAEASMMMKGHHGKCMMHSKHGKCMAKHGHMMMKHHMMHIMKKY